MTGFVLAEFATAHAMLAASRVAAEAHMPAEDVLMPHAVEGASDHLKPPHPKKPLGWVMFLAACSGAVGGYFLEWFSAVVDYPIISGGRPLNAWQVFVLVPYEAAILLACLFGFFGWLAMCSLPKLHHPLFAGDGAERATQDRYVLVFAARKDIAARIQKLLDPVAIHEVHE